MWLALLTSLVGLVACSMLGSPKVYYNATSDYSYPLDLFNEFFAGGKYMVISNATEQRVAVSARAVEISPPISNFSKFSHSLMFWPIGNFTNTVENCTYNLGLHKPGKSLYDLTTTLVNSMTYFEVMKVPVYNSSTNNESETRNFFMAITLDKTASGYQLNRQIESQAAAFLSDQRCDSVLYGSINKTYFICWHLLEIDDKRLKDVISHKLEIKVIVWDPRKGFEVSEDKKVLRLTTDQAKRFEYKSEAKKDPPTLKAIALRSVSQEYFDVAVFFQTMEYFLIIRIRGDRFEEFQFPKQNKGSMDEIGLTVLTANDTRQKIFVYEARYIDGNMFLLTQHNPSFNDTNSSTYGDVYYLEATGNGLLMTVGKGIVVAVRKGMDEYRHPSLSDFMVITDNVPINKGSTDPLKPKNRISIQIRKYYQGYIYGDQQYELEINGDPRYFKGYRSQMYFIYVDQSSSQPIEGCESLSYYNSTVYIAPLEKPYMVKELIRFTKKEQNPLRILVSPNNNLLYLRSSYKLEVYNLMHIMKDLKKLKEVDFELIFGSQSLVRTYSTKPNNETMSQGTPILEVYLPSETLDKSSTKVTLDDIVMNRNESAVVKINITEKQNQYKYPAHLDQIKIVGNYLSFLPGNCTSCSKAELEPFEMNPMKLMNSDMPDQTIAKLYAMNINERRFVLISYSGDIRNEIFQLNADNRQYESYMVLYDNRIVSAVQEISNEKYLLHIEGLLYELYILNKTMNPLFKSNDLCGEVWTSVDHNELGPLTVCGGGGLITVFASTATEKRKIDLSSPIDNLRVNPSLIQAIKQESVDSLFSSVILQNRFGTASKIIHRSNMTAAQMSDETASMVRIRIFEISSAMQYVDLLPESEMVVNFEFSAEKVLPYLIKDRLVLLVRFLNRESIAFKEDSIYVYFIDGSFNLTLEKIISIPRQLIADFDVIKPLMTYLPVNKTLLSSTYGPKLLIMFLVERKSYDIAKNLDFFDFKKFIDQNKSYLQYSKLIGVFDPFRSSLDCIKLLELPDDFMAISFGSYFLDVKESDFAQGAVVAASNGKETRIFFMNDHSMIADFHVLSAYEDYFRLDVRTNHSYNFVVKNHLNNLNRSVEMNLTINLAILADFNMSVKDDPKLVVNLTDPKELDKQFMLYTKKNDILRRVNMISGMPYLIDFKYDSKIEQISKQISASLTITTSPYIMHKINNVRQLLFDKSQKIPKDASKMMSKKIMQEWLEPKPEDYVDILYISRSIGTPKCVFSKRNIEIRANPNLRFKRRCVKFYYISNEEPKSNQNELLACLELGSIIINGSLAQLNMYIFDERENDNLYNAESLERHLHNFTLDINKIPLADIQLRATMNFLVVLRTSSLSNITYYYEVFKVSNTKTTQEPFGYQIKSVHSTEIWTSQISFTSFFLPDATNQTKDEAFCTVYTTKVDIVIVNYYCANFINGMAPARWPTVQKVDFFRPFRYQEIDVVVPDVTIYSVAMNPLDFEPVATNDKNLYFIVSFPTSLSAFVRVNMTTNKPDYALLCNPFDGYLFMKEHQILNSKFFARFGVRKRETYIWFYNLPLVNYKNNTAENITYYSQDSLEEAFQTKTQLTCINPVYIMKLDDQVVEKVFKLQFYRRSPNNKALPAKSDNQETFDLIGERSSFKVEKSALQILLLTNNGTNFTRLEYLPAIQVHAESELLFSDKIQIEILGLRNQRANTTIQIKSGSFKNPTFLFTYMLPLICMILGLVGLNWLLRFVFYNQDPDDLNDSRLPSIFRVKEFARRISSLKKRVSLDTYGPRATKLSGMNIDASVMNNYKRKIEEDRMRKENIIVAKRKKEILGIHSELLESDIANENVEMMVLREMRDQNRLRLEIIENDRREDQEKEPIDVTEENAESYAAFKDFMDSEEALERKLEKKERRLKKTLLQKEVKEESSGGSSSDDSDESESSILDSGRSSKSISPKKIESDNSSSSGKSDKSESESEKKSSDFSGKSAKSDEMKDERDIGSMINASLLLNLNVRFDSHKKHVENDPAE